MKNGGFDTLDANNQPVSWAFHAGWSVDVGRTGTGFSAKITEPASTPGSFSATQTLSLTRGLYRLTGWIKTVNAATNCPTCTGQGGYRLSLGSLTGTVIHGTTDWTFIELDNIVIDADQQLSLKLEIYSSFDSAALQSVPPNGTAWFDDVKVEKLLPFPLDVFMLYPNFRGMLFDDKPQTMKFDVTVTPRDGSSPTAHTVTGTLKEQATGNVLVTRTFAGAANFVAEIDGTSMVPGTAYLVEFTLDGGAYTYPPYLVSKVPAADRDKMNVVFDEKNRILLQDPVLAGQIPGPPRPRFLLGVYDAGIGFTTVPSAYEQTLWAPDGDRRMGPLVPGAPAPDGLPLRINALIEVTLGAASPEGLAALMDNLKDHGAMYLAIANCFQGATHWDMGKAAQSGFFAIDDPTTGDSYVQTIGSHQRSLGYYTMDECTAGREEIIQTTFDQYLRLRNLDPVSITFAAGGGAGGRDRELFLWRDAADLLGMDPYMLTDPVNFNVANWTKATRAAVKDSRPTVQVLQFHNGLAPRFPTLEEMRNHALMAIVEGAKGLFWWEIGNQQGGLANVCSGWCQQKTDLMNQLKTIVNQIADLEPWLIADDDATRLVGSSNSADPDPSTGAPGVGAIRTLVKIANGSAILFAYNTRGGTTTETTTFTWNVAPGTVVVDGEGRTIPPTGNQFSDTFGPFQGHIYRISNIGTPGPLTVSFVTPTNGATVSGTTTVNLAASGGTGAGYIFTFTDGVTTFTGTPPFSWNTTTLPAGSRTLSATVKDSSGAVSPTASITVTVSPPPSGPTASITSPANGATVSGTVTVGMSVTGAAAGSNTFKLSVDGTLVSTQTVAGTTASFAWDTNAVASGLHTLALTVTDSAGGSGSTSISVTVMKASITSPANGATVSGTVTVGMSVAGAATTSNTFKLSIDGTLVSTVTAAGTTTSYAWDTTALAVGSSHMLSVTVTDGAGHSATSSTVTVTIGSSTTPLTVGVTAPKPGDAVSGTNWVVVWPSGAQGTPTCTFTVGTQQVAQAACGASPTTIPWDTKLVPDGSQVLTVTITDSTTRTGTASVSIVVANTPLTPSITSPAAGQTVTGTVTIGMSATGAVNGATFKLSVDTTLVSTQTVAGTTASYAWDTTTVAAGNHTLSLTVTDGAGRTVTAPAVGVTVSSTPLTVGVTAPKPGDTVSGTNWVVVWPSGAQGTPTCTFTVGTQQVAQAACGASPTTIPWDTKLVPDGSQVLTVTITDSTTRTGTASVSIMVANSPLTVSITAPRQGDVISGTNWVAVWAGNAQGTPTCTITVDGTQVAQQTCGGSPTTIPWNTTLVTNGAHTITVTIRDATTRTGTASVGVTVAN